MSGTRFRILRDGGDTWVGCGYNETDFKTVDAGDGDVEP